MSSLAERTQQLFATVMGYRPVGVWSAPGRVNLIGEHTDYNDGFALPMAINRRTAVAVGLRDDRSVRVTSSFDPEVVEIDLDEISADTVSGWSAYPLGVIWALNPPADARGVDLVIDSSVPVGAGLSSSAAIECAVAVALTELWGLTLTPMQLARVGQKAENDIVGAPTGLMDQIASMHGLRDHAVLIDCRELSATPIELGFDDHNLVLLVIDTQVRHSHATGGYKERRASCESACAKLGIGSLRELTVSDLPLIESRLSDVEFRRVRHVVTENDRVLSTARLVQSGGPHAIGSLLDESHISMRDDYEISTRELDCAVEVSRSTGAIGSRMTGGGFGGAAIALVPNSAAEAVSVAVTEEFARRGYDRPDIFTVAPAEGARRDF
ncbi:MAG: galactokinase [Microbacteriaceae bacterium]